MSAFFGLTFLGSQGSFDRVKETPIHIFQGRDFQDAFMQTYRPGFSLYSESDEDVQAANAELDSATITLAQLPDVLRHLYKCPKGADNVPASARTLVEQAFRLLNGTDTSQSIDLATFLAQMDEVCRHSQSLEAASSHNAYLKDGLPTREFVSNLDFQAKLVKHQRMEKDPREKALAPVTDSITFGWNEPTIATKRMPNKSCDETRFASAMVKAGVYYY
ncbi:hypothetical protein GN244_ATG05914 [Phytophthora infestans]|uniref:Uncharacterized protein n=1 Tax=Phytophthora infestans TaxID=4787 RepID=A0A833SYB4_PHYIN|nr:hypothetical protein GN244_ATG05914 [Phytophthora infestans]KAF4144246.1 hypothetical protein GN958_ATG06567 [Phytophthora infestans]KAF4145540.1 hypothetical protein GN958_ATG05268 [Phytophthora infestans]